MPLAATIQAAPVGDGTEESAGSAPEAGWPEFEILYAEASTLLAVGGP